MKLLALVWMTLSFSLCAAQSQYIKVNEFALEYQIAGSGKHIVLLEAGGSSAMTDWDPVFSQIAEQATVIRYSRVGNGNSTQIKRHFTSRDYADYASELLEKLKISEPVILVAHSYGGSVARDFAAAYPAKVKALLLLDPSSEHDVDIIRAIDLEQGNHEIAQIKLDDMKEGMSNQYLDFWSKRPLPDYPQINAMPVTVIVSVKKVENPSNLFFTEQGRKLWGEHWQSWATAFPQGRAVLTENSGHFVQFDEPQLVLQELTRLVGQLDQPQKI
ncbi:alpha/beta hydrolase [Arsukibacterium sp.]|uniref:alpha/beta fold hydrolase n=1 Tax=Arsukibacterium sp. TaxID=1977258 RepID=UPI001BD30234|nr:alpha/beta hydrolase [Arsukibacterium sp.]